MQLSMENDGLWEVTLVCLFLIIKVVVLLTFGR